MDLQKTPPNHISSNMAPDKLCAAFSMSFDPSALHNMVTDMLKTYGPRAYSIEPISPVPWACMASGRFAARLNKAGADPIYQVIVTGAYANGLDLASRHLPEVRALGAGDLAELTGDLLFQAGPAIIGDMNGIFSLVYCDCTRDQVVVANDRYGFSALYYYSRSDLLLIASEIKAIAAVTDLTHDPTAYGQFFYGQQMLRGQTLFNEIRSLGPGEYLVWEPHQLKRRQYWDVATMPEPESNQPSIADIKAAFDQAVHIRLLPGVKDTLLLSGGSDSRWLLGALLRQGRSPKLMSLEHAGFLQGLDGRLARQVAEIVGLPIDFRPTRPDFYQSVDALDVFHILDGMIPVFGLFISQVYPELDPSLGRVWDGIGMDICFGKHARPGHTFRENLDYFFASRPVNQRYLRQTLDPAWFAEIQEHFDASYSAETEGFPDTEDGWVRFELVHRKRRRNCATSFQLYTRKVQVLTPALDVELLDFMLTVPQNQRRNGQIHSAILQDYYPELTQIPFLSGEREFSMQRRQLGSELVEQARGSFALRKLLKDLGLAPHARALYNQLRGVDQRKRDTIPADLVVRCLRTTGFDRPIYNRPAVEKALHKVESGSLHWLSALTPLFYIELWHHIFNPADRKILREQVFRPSANIDGRAA